MSKIYVGTSGYSYNDWIGPVYPEGTRKDRFLSFYADMFPTVEINYTYYQMPTAKQLSGYIDKVGPRFTFSVKANEYLTHKIIPAAWQEAVTAFLTALEPLREHNRLSAVLFQFPFSFHYNPDRRRYLDSLLKAFQGLPVAVEFRNNEWINDRVITAFKQREITLVSLDMPLLKGLPPTMDVVTAPLVYIRFHGKNNDAWWGSDAVTRYDYLYSQKELETWAHRIKGISGNADRILIYFNNHFQGKAVRNAQMLAQILDKAGLMT